MFAGVATRQQQDGDHVEESIQRTFTPPYTDAARKQAHQDESADAAVGQLAVAAGEPAVLGSSAHCPEAYAARTRLRQSHCEYERKRK